MTYGRMQKWAWRDLNSGQLEISPDTKKIPQTPPFSRRNIVNVSIIFVGIAYFVMFLRIEIHKKARAQILNS